MYHLTAWPTYKNTPPISYHKMFRQQLQLRPAEGKQGKKYLPLLKFTSRCCLFTKFLSSHEIWTHFGGIASKTSSTLEMLSTMKYSTVKILWSDLVTTTIMTRLNPFFPPRPRHRKKAHGFGIRAHLQPSEKLTPLFWRPRRHLHAMSTFKTKLLAIFPAPGELHEDFHVWSIFVLPNLITNNPPSKTSAGWTCLWTWQIWTTLVLARTSKQASHVNLM